MSSYGAFPETKCFINLLFIQGVIKHKVHDCVSYDSSNGASELPVYFTICDCYGLESLLGRESTTSDVTVPDWLRQYSPHGAEPIRRPPHGLLLPQPITGDL